MGVGVCSFGAGAFFVGAGARAYLSRPFNTPLVFYIYCIVCFVLVGGSVGEIAL
jgi:hypothetical protein